MTQGNRALLGFDMGDRVMVVRRAPVLSRARLGRYGLVVGIDHALRADGYNPLAYVAWHKPSANEPHARTGVPAFMLVRVHPSASIIRDVSQRFAEGQRVLLAEEQHWGSGVLSMAVGHMGRVVMDRGEDIVRVAFDQFSSTREALRWLLEPIE
jgi:hypothetical protein